MAQPPHPSSLLPATQPVFSGIDAAVASVIDNNPSSNTDIIGTAVTLSTVTMDRIESMMQKLRNRGKRIPKVHHPLTVDRPFARAQSPPPKTAVERSTRTGREVSPTPRTGRGAEPSERSTRTGRGLSPVPRSSGYPTAVEPERSLRTGRGLSPVPRSSGYPTAVEPTPPLSPADRRQSISNVHLPSTRTGREVSPRPSQYLEPAVHTGRGVSPTPRSSGYPTAMEPASPLPPASRRQSISNLQIPSTRTGREVTPPPSKRLDRSEPSVRTGRGVSPTPRSSGYPTARALSPAPRTGRGAEPSERSIRTGRGVSPQPKTAVSPLYPTAVSMSPEPRTAFTPSPVSSHAQSDVDNSQRPLTPAEQWKNVNPGPGPKICPAKSPVLHTAREPQNLRSTRELQNEPKANEIWNDLVKAAEKQRVPSAVCSPGLNKTQAEPSERSLRTGRGTSPAPKSSGYRTAAEAASPLPPASRRQSISNVQLPSTRTGREVSPQPRSSGYPTALSQSPPPKTALGADASERSLRTGRGTSPAPKTGRGAEPSERSTRTGRGLSPVPRSSGYPTAKEPSAPPSPASRRQSISNVQIPSTRTGREVTPPPSKRLDRSEPSVRTGRGVSPTPRSSGYPTARALSPAPRTGRGAEPSERSLRTGRGTSPAPRSSGYRTALEAASPLPPASRHQSISNVQIPSTRTGLELSPRPSESSQYLEPVVHTGRGSSPTPRSSGYPTAVEPTPPLSPANRRQSISNVHLPSTRTGREASPPQNNSFRLSTANDVLDRSTRTGREASPPRVPSAMNPELITRTTVVPVNQNGEDGPPGVMLFVHSFYVFSMTLNAWANYLSNQNAPPPSAQ